MDLDAPSLLSGSSAKPAGQMADTRDTMVNYARALTRKVLTTRLKFVNDGVTVVAGFTMLGQTSMYAGRF